MPELVIYPGYLSEGGITIYKDLITDYIPSASLLGLVININTI